MTAGEESTKCDVQFHDRRVLLLLMSKTCSRCDDNDVRKRPQMGTGRRSEVGELIVINREDKRHDKCFYN